MLNINFTPAGKNVLARIELMHNIRKGRPKMEISDEMSFANQFYSLAR